MLERTEPNKRIQELRTIFAWAKPTAKPKRGRPPAYLRDGALDPDIRDGLGQLHLCGLLDGFGSDPLDMRNAGREWGEWKAGGCEGVHHVRAMGFEAKVDGGNNRPAYTRDRSGRGEGRFDKMDAVLNGYEEGLLSSLTYDWLVGRTVDDYASPPWARALVAESLRQSRGIIWRKQPFVTDNCRHALKTVGKALSNMVIAVEARRAA